MKESNFQTMFNKWIKNNMPNNSLVLELKIEKGKSMRFDKVSDHQVESLYNSCCGSGFFHKITDPPVFKEMKTRFNVKRPFDCFFMKHVESYIVIWFYKPRQKKEMLWVDIGDFIGHREVAKSQNRASLKEEEWKKIATHIFNF